MDSINQLINKRDYSLPPEAKIIKDFIKKNYDSEAEIKVSDFQILIIVSSSALASSIRFDLPALKKLLKTDKKLVLRVSN